MLARKVLFLVVNFLLTYITVSVEGIRFDLDTEQEHEADRRMWKIKGNALYLDEGSTMRNTIASNFPPRFEFGNFDHTMGIWALVPIQRDCETPDMESNENMSHEKKISELFNNEKSTTSEVTATPSTKSTTRKRRVATSITTPLCYSPSNATFQFKLRSLLMDSISIRYCLGGSAELRLEQGTLAPQQMSAFGQYNNQWTETKFSAGGTEMQLIAHVSAKGDYVLIDRITVQTWEPSSTPKPTTTETPTPIPSPGSGESRPLSYVPTILLISLIRTLVSYLF